MEANEAQKHTNTMPQQHPHVFAAVHRPSFISFP
jgi:hypothetical protein